MKASLMPAVCWLLIDMDYFNNSIEHDSEWGWEEKKERTTNGIKSDGHTKTIIYIWNSFNTRVSVCACCTLALLLWLLLLQQYVGLWYFNYDSSKCAWHFLIFICHLFCGAFFFPSLLVFFSFGSQSQTVNTWNNNSCFCVTLKMPW